MKGRAIVSFVLVACVCILGLFMPQSTVGLHSGDPINGADTAWVMVAAALVLIMTPGLGFFMVEWPAEKYYLYCFSKCSLLRRYKLTLGFCGF